MSIPKKVNDVMIVEKKLLHQVLSEIKNRDVNADPHDLGKQMTYFNKVFDLIDKIKKHRRDMSVEFHGKDLRAIETSPEAIENLSLLDEARRDLDRLQ